MKNFNLNISYFEEGLELSNFPSSAETDEEITICYRMIEGIELKGIEEVVFDLSRIPGTDLKTTAFLDSAIRFFMRKKIKVKLNNLSSELSKFLLKTGIRRDATGYATLLFKPRNDESFFTNIGESTLKFFKDAANLFYFTGDLFYTICKSIRHPSKVKWRETFYYMDKAGTDAIPIVLLLCFLLGAILAFQGIVQMGKFGLSIYTANLVGLSIVKELGALMVAMICVGRAGSAFASEISTMKVNEEIDAMKTMGLEISSFLVLPKMLALILVMPLLTVVGNVAGIIGGMAVGTLTSDITLSEYYLRTISSLKCFDVFESIFKSAIYAVLISGISCLRGIEAEKDAKGVGHSATSAVVSSIFLIVVADSIITVILNS